MSEWDVMTISSVSSSASSSLSPSPERKLSPRPYEANADACFAYFQLHTVDYLAGLLDRGLSPFILRAVEQNEALYHAALAMGSMHKTIMSGQKLQIQLDDNQYAIQQYTKALRKLVPGQDHGTTVPVEVILTACLLFIGFEVCDRGT